MAGGEEAFVMSPANVVSAHQVLDDVSSTLQILTLIFTVPLAYCCYPHFTDEKTDALRDYNASTSRRWSWESNPPDSRV